MFCFSFSQIDSSIEVFGPLMVVASRTLYLIYTARMLGSSYAKTVLPGTLAPAISSVFL